ncbi:MAG: hypothetical protein HY043_23465 [Verrucomicrobia bacterium]|nr:hypothetical protein [Verrucomicrobiota bacterium]
MNRVRLLMLQSGAAFLVTGFVLFSTLAHGASPDPDVAVLGQILAAAPPGASLVPVGDMWFKVSMLKAWRDHLAKPVAPNSIGPIPASAFQSPINLWPGGVIPYTFDPAVTAPHQKAFLDAAAEWASFANIQFIPRTTESDYVTLQNCPSCSGGNSTVGHVGGQQFINIGGWNRGTLGHEIGHTLGLIHEHQRSDRDTYVVILSANVQPGQLPNFIKLPSTNQGAYDFYSVMHYSRNAISIDPTTLDTIRPQPAYAQFLNIMGQQNWDRTLSTDDRTGMAAAYGVPATLPSATVTNTKDSGPGSLRTSIYYGIDHPGTTILFHIPTNDPGYNGTWFTIQLSDQLTRLGGSTTIDGTTQTTFSGDTNPSGPEIALDGSPAENYIDGVKMTEANCTAKSLVINGCTSYGVHITGATATNNVVAGCFVGTSASGSAAITNAYGGVAIDNGANWNRIGGTTVSDRNVISGNTTQGILIGGAGTMNNVIQGNYIGLNAMGTASLPNTYSGIAIFGGAQNNTIGGTVAGAGNVISGNLLQGLTISDAGTSGNRVQGNLIGLNPAGTVAIPNAWAGVDIFGGASANTIGGTSAGARNTISGNTLQGVGISGAGSDGNLVQGNYIGLNPSGTGAIANGWSGVSIFNGAHSTIIGGTAAGARNIISGNGTQGVTISDAGTSGNLIAGNFIGLTAAGTAAVGNTWSGVDVFGAATSNTIGGLSAASRNIISGNLNYGITFSGSGTSANAVQGNFIGVDPTGATALANSYAGVGIFSGAQANTVGGTAAGMRNVISGNLNQGVAIGGAGTTGNSVSGNFIGLDFTGLIAIGNGWSGVDINGGAASNVIGGTTGGARNYISANANYGVVVNGAGSDANLVQGNSIGLNLVSVAAGNVWSGVALYNGPQANFIGGTSDGAGNIIANNVNAGVAVYDVTTINNSILGNSINNNGWLGIDLAGDGVTSNTSGGPHAGPNNLQNHPVLTPAPALLATGTRIQGTLNGQASTTFRVEFFASPAADGSGYGEGQFFLGAKTDVTTDGSGNATFSITVAPCVPAGYLVSATATDPAGNTSEFSADATVATTDSDGDGLPDAYETAHGLNAAAANDASLDADGDGQSNLAEFKAGTDPQNAASVLSAPVVVETGSGATISFNSVAGKIYRLESNDTLNSGSWGTLISPITGTGGVMSLSDASGSGVTTRFYRIVMLP